MARGLAFQLVEAMGVLPREGQVARDVKELDQHARGLLRKHGVRFGQFTVFMPLLLKPAPTRLRLVLWGLWQGLDEFPESPPPGLVTIPAPAGAPEGYVAMSGYRVAGTRAIRIDMLERLADQIRGQDTRGGFEATADMLSITGMTLEQFADLMQGLGYRAERGEREKQRPAAGPAPAPSDGAADAPPEAPATPADGGAEVQAAPVVEAVASDPPGPGTPEDPPPPPEQPETPSEPEAPQPADPTPPPGTEVPDPGPVEIPSTPETGPETGPTMARDRSGGDTGAEVGGDTDAAAQQSPETAEARETEVFYTFTWAPRRASGGPRRGRDGEGGAPRGKQGQGDGQSRGKPGGPRAGGKGKRDRDKREGDKRGPKDGKEGAKVYQARPPKREKPIDPDNPFAAALMGLKDKS